MKTIGWCAIALGLLGCKDDKPAPKTETPPAKPVAAAPDAAAAPAPAAACDLVGTLELRRVTPAAKCGEKGRYDSLRLELVAATARGDVLALELGDPDALGNVMATAETRSPPANGSCAVTLTIADAGRADDDQSFTYTLTVPAAGGAVAGTLAHSGVDGKGKACATESAVEGTFTRGGAAAGPGVAGPHATLEAYCQQRIAGFVAAECESPGEGDMCSCAPAAKDLVAGTITTKGSGLIQEAALVAAADSYAGYVQCDIAVKVAAGWYVAPAAFPCGPAPASHDGGISVTVDTLHADGDQLHVAWTEEGSTPGARPAKKKLTCTATAGAAPTCVAGK